MQDLISVIVPIYHVEKYLEKCIQSICNQTYFNLEIILVDDGSDDKCPQICDQYAKLDSRIKVIHQNNGGIDNARKSGFMLANGKYIGYVDGDDWIEPTMYEKLLAYANLYDVDVVESGVIDSWEKEEKERPPFLREGCYKGEKFTNEVESRMLYAGTFFQHGVSPYLWSKIFKKDKIEKYQLMSDMLNQIQNDTMVSLPCIAKTRSLYITHDCFYHYRMVGNSAKRRVKSECANEFIQCYKDYFSRFEGTLLCSPNDKQLYFFFMYWLLLKAPYVFDDLDQGRFLTPFGGIQIGTRAVIYGAGAAGIVMENYVRNIQENALVCWVDRKYKDLQKAYKVYAPQKMKEVEFDYVIVSILKADAVKSARDEIKRMGIAEDKILWIRQEYIEDPILLLKKAKYLGKFIFNNL